MKFISMSSLETVHGKPMIRFHALEEL